MTKKRPTSSRQRRLCSAVPTLGVCLGMLLSIALAGTAGSQVETPNAGPRLALAIEAQRSLIDTAPRDPALFSDLGNLLTLDQQWVGAEEAYRSALTIDPDYTPAQFNLALLLQRKGDLDEALALYDSVVATEPENAWAHYQRGRIFQARKDRRSAIDAYAAAFAADPELTFPDVNPHLAENPLATEAILEVDASRLSVSPDNAPRAYNDASRIIHLLVPPISHSPDKAATESDPTSDSPTEPEAAESATGGSAGLVRPEPELEEDAAGTSRSLGNEDLDSLGSFNQASPQPESSPRTPRGAVTSPRRTQGVPLQGARTQPGAAQPSAPATPNRPNTPQIDRSRPRPRPGTGFRPGSRSSAQLDLRLERGDSASPSP